MAASLTQDEAESEVARDFTVCVFDGIETRLHNFARSGLARRSQPDGRSATAIRTIAPISIVSCREIVDGPPPIADGPDRNLAGAARQEEECQLHDFALGRPGESHSRRSTYARQYPLDARIAPHLRRIARIRPSERKDGLAGTSSPKRRDTRARSRRCAPESRTPSRWEARRSRAGPPGNSYGFPKRIRRVATILVVLRNVGRSGGLPHF